MDQSLISLSEYNGITRVSAALGKPPLKLLFPKQSDQFATVIQTNYGGGWVEGDQINLKIHCGPNSKGYIGSQALTRIYKSEKNIACVQNINGHLEKNALLAYLPDLAVPQISSIFNQQQDWELEKNSLLILFDGYSAGRISRGELFAFQKYQSQIKVSREGELHLLENYVSDPAKYPPLQEGNHGAYTVCASYYILGYPEDPKYITLNHAMIQMIESTEILKLGRKNKPLLCACDSPREGVTILRVLGRSIEEINPVQKIIGQALALDSLLGSDPICRKI